MTEADSGPVAERLQRLSEIRKELTTARADLRKYRKKLEDAGHRAEHDQIDIQTWWPSPEEFRGVDRKIRDLENESGTVIRELQAFGVDSGLFKLNGDN